MSKNTVAEASADTVAEAVESAGSRYRSLRRGVRPGSVRARSRAGASASRSGGRPAAATLDVFDTEPLPRDHPFWAMDNVHVSAHMCGDVAGWRDELAAQFEDNLRRWTAGEQLVNEVDKDAGYVRSR